ncbi:hypothetical protein HK103_006961 [Boothiomyces macroporosus]|uniref:Uncharacterized protein n=1 Tax=Boothiomyces macroporosus TaxID=261099 RepID=A0AAD5Y7T9_9FUNG|nr:hypothetical protein HK103_006961 [Boothiomyces macroporosus]
MMAQVSTSYKLHSADALALEQNIPIPAPQKPLAAAAEPGSPVKEHSSTRERTMSMYKTHKPSHH